MQALLGHSAWVRSVAFSPVEPLLVSAGDDATVRVWDLADGTCRHVWEGHVGRVWSLAFSHDGRLIMSGGIDGTMRVWELGSGRCLHILRRHREGVFTVAAHPHSPLVASGGEDGQINLWDAQRGQWLAALQRRAGGLAAIAFNPEGTLLASGSQGGFVELWEVEGARQRAFVGRLHDEKTAVSSIVFTADGLAASVARGGSVKIWQARTGKVMRTIQGYSSLITALSFSPDGSLLAQGDDNGTVRVWDLAGARYLTQVHGHSGPIWALAWSPDSAMLASSGDDGQVKVWEARSGHCLMDTTRQGTTMWALAFRHDGALLASAGGARPIELWQVGRGNPASPPGTLSGATDHVISLAFSRSGTMLASGHGDGSVRLWDPLDGQCLQTMHHGNSPVGALCFTDDEGVLLSASDSLVVWWDVATGRCCQTAPITSGRTWFKAIAFSGDAGLLVLAGEERTVRLWHIEQPGGLVAGPGFAGHASQAWAVAVSPDTHVVASSDDTGTVVLWEASTGAEIRRIAHDRPYERMQIQGVTGLNAAQRAALKALGAVERQEPS